MAAHRLGLDRLEAGLVVALLLLAIVVLLLLATTLSRRPILKQAEVAGTLLPSNTSTVDCSKLCSKNPYF